MWIKHAMKKFLAIVPALLAVGAIADAANSAHARTLTFMNSQGYQMQLAASRKAYADAVAAQSAPQATHRTTRKKKAAATKP
jgi:hypothetical protein